MAGFDLATRMPDIAPTLLGVLAGILSLSILIVRGTQKRREDRAAAAQLADVVQKRFEERMRKQVDETVKGNDLGRLGDLLRGHTRMQDADEAD